MSTLHDRLVDLAADAPASAPDPLLWERARAFHRRRRAGTALAVGVSAVLVGVLASVMVWRVEAPVRPAAPGAEPALPTRLEEPSAWLPGTGGHPIGPLAALLPAERSSLLGSAPGIVGVSATTGEYRFLDLPDDAGEDWAMSQDGRQVAYWTTGETAQSPNTRDGAPIAGVAIYDTVSGEVVRHDIATDHGLSSDRGLWWADPTTLVLSYFQWLGGIEDSENDQSSARQAEPLVWRVGEAGPSSTELRVSSIDATNGRGQVLNHGRVVDLESGQEHRIQDPRTVLRYQTALDPSGYRVAFPRGNRNPGPLAVTDVDAIGRSTIRTVVAERVRQAVAWIDGDHVAYLISAGGVQPKGFLESVDVTTGERERLLTFPGYSIEPGQLATDLLATPPVERERPAQPWSPRVLLAWSTAVLLAGAYGLWRWRRRVEL